MQLDEKIKNHPFKCEIEENILVDPTSMEEKYATGNLLCSVMPTFNEITFISQSGDMKYSSVVEATDLAMDACSKIHELMKQTLVISIKKKLSKSSDDALQPQQQQQEEEEEEKEQEKRADVKGNKQEQKPQKQQKQQNFSSKIQPPKK